MGAGPGDPGLLTVRAQDEIRRAEVLLYDALVNEAIVALAPENCERIFVGKRGGESCTSQDEIAELLVSKARAGKRVVRLKGGDPFVFGRGGEEAQQLQKSGIDFAVIPGITSAVAAPAYAGIPVTHRDYATILTIVSGHEDPSKERSAIDWAKLANPQQTVVFLMAMSNLAEIAERLMQNGMPAKQPAAVIAHGTLPAQQTVTGTIGTIANVSAEQGLTAPAVLVVGEVVALRSQIAWFERSPLFGKRVLITRPARQSAAFAHELHRYGAQPVLAPAIEIVPPDDPIAAAQATLHPSDYTWVVFTSSNGVDAFFKHLDARRDDARVFGDAKIAAIGLKTSQALLERNIYPDAVPQTYVAEELADLIVALSQPGDRILLYRAAVARDVLPDRLTAAGRIVESVAAYKTAFTNDPMFARQVESADILTFTSASTVAGFVHNLGSGRARHASADKTIACIGPITAQAAKDAGLHVDIVADEYTANGLIAALLRTYSSATR